MKEKIITPKYLYTLGTILHVLEFKLLKKTPKYLYTLGIILHALEFKLKKEKRKKKEDKY
jgi:hypothetical protein